YVLPEGFSSTAFTALEPMSRPTTVLAFPKSGIDPLRSGQARQRMCHRVFRETSRTILGAPCFAPYRCAIDAHIRKVATYQKLLTCCVIGRFRRVPTRSGSQTCDGGYGRTDLGVLS